MVSNTAWCKVGAYLSVGSNIVKFRCLIFFLVIYSSQRLLGTIWFRLGIYEVSLSQDAHFIKWTDNWLYLKLWTWWISVYLLYLEFQRVIYTPWLLTEWKIIGKKSVILVAQFEVKIKLYSVNFDLVNYGVNMFTVFLN